MRTTVAAAVACALLTGLSVAADVQASIKRDVSIPAGGLGPALRALSNDRKIHFIFVAEDVKELRSPGATGTVTTEDALRQLLKGTGLTYRYIDDETISILPLKAPSSFPAASNGAVPNPLASFQEQGAVQPSDHDNDRSFWNRFRLAQLDRASQPASASSGNTETNRLILDEVIVTAQKRGEENLLQVPIPITVLNTQTLVDRGQTRLEDYFKRIPGLALAPASTGVPIVAIRGMIASAISNPTAGIVIDDLAYGPTINPGSLPFVPDIDPGDLAQVEVLRGPQGTLYGASSLGGLLKFTTVDPSTEGLSSRFQVGGSSVKDGSDLGYSFHGSANVPLSDTLALRASGFTREDPGYVDNVSTGQRDLNSTELVGGRFAALWRPSDAFSLKLSALIQDSEKHGSADVDGRLDGLQNSAQRGTGTENLKTQVYNMTMAGQLGEIDLISVTGYSVDNSDLVFDTSKNAFWTGLSNTYFGVTGASTPVFNETNKFTQEVRLSMPVGRRIELLLGGFYSDEDFENDWNTVANDSNTGDTVGTTLKVVTSSAYSEYAAFANLTIDVTDRLDIQVGGRISEIEQSFSALRSGPAATLFYGSDPSLLPEVGTKDTPVTYLLTPRFRISPDLMVYARLATGYRPGGSNNNCRSGIPCQFDPDTTQNYDIGAKGRLFDGALLFDASLYHIDWKDIQVQLVNTTPGFGNTIYTDNTGKGRSQGVELSLEVKPRSGLTLSAWGTLSDAEITENCTMCSPPLNAGDRLPYSSRVSGNFSIDQEFPLWGDAVGFVGGSVTYVGDRKGAFRAATQVRETFPAYSQVDLHAKVDVRGWTYTAFVNNLTDKRAIFRSGLDGSPTSDYITYIRPRVIGVNIGKSF